MKLLKFEAGWCSACKTLTKVMEDISFPFPVEVIDADVDSTPLIEYGVRGLPTLILLDENNNTIKRITGLQTKEQLTEAFQLQP